MSGLGQRNRLSHGPRMICMSSSMSLIVVMDDCFMLTITIIKVISLTIIIRVVSLLRMLVAVFYI